MAESEAFLAGRCDPESYCPVGTRMPAWLPLSWIAHADRSTLLGLRDSGSATWLAGADYLAAEIVAVAPDEAALLALQRTVLVPLELDVLDGRSGCPRTAPELVELVLSAIRHYHGVSS